MSQIAVTCLHAREAYFDAFINAAFANATAAEEADGCIYAEAVMEADGYTLWTRSVWIDRISMRRFVQSNGHGARMSMLREWCDEAAMVNWEQDDPRPPPWGYAHERLQREGRSAVVDHPSMSHQEFKVRVPVLPD